MFNEKKPIPLLCRGPDKTRCYANEPKRWSVVEGSDSDAFKARLVLRQGWGLRETLGVVIIPVVGLVIFGSVGLAVWHAKPDGDFAVTFLSFIVLIFVGQLILFRMFINGEVRYFDAWPAEVLTVYADRTFTLEGDVSYKRELPVGSILRYTQHDPEPGSQGASSYSELDLVVRDGKEVIAKWPLLADKYNLAWKKAQKLSKAIGIPLERIVLQSNGKPYPPALTN
ncbi:hypothetical protein [Mariniblastus fucicola]|nr:hypothetical protein [Mariniblastus fucicola]